MGTYTQTVTYTNTRRSAIKNDMQQSYIESSPDRHETEALPYDQENQPMAVLNEDIRSSPSPDRKYFDAIHGGH